MTHSEPAKVASLTDTFDRVGYSKVQSTVKSFARAGKTLQGDSHVSKTEIYIQLDCRHKS